MSAFYVVYFINAIYAFYLIAGVVQACIYWHWWVVVLKVYFTFWNQVKYVGNVYIIRKSMHWIITELLLHKEVITKAIFRSKCVLTEPSYTWGHCWKLRTVDAEESYKRGHYGKHMSFFAEATYKRDQHWKYISIFADSTYKRDRHWRASLGPRYHICRRHL